MARLQWEPIAIPAIGDSSIRAQQMAGASIQGAFAGLQGVLTDYEAQRREANLAILAERQNRFGATDAGVTGYQAELANGGLTRGLSFLRASDTANLRDYTNTLRSGRNADTAFARGQTLAGREDKSYELSQENLRTAPIIERERNRIAGLVSTGQMTEAQANEAEAALASVTNDAQQLSRLYGSAEDGVARLRGNEAYTDQRADRQFSLQERQLMLDDRTDARTASAIIEKYRGLGGTFADLEASDDWRNANPQQRTIIRNAFGGTAPEGGAAGGGAFSGGLDAARSSVSTYLQAQGASPAAVAGIMGNLEVEGGYGGALGDNGSASGIAQWRNERRAAFRQRFGKDPHQATHAEQAQFLTWELLSPEGRAVSGVSEANARRIWNATDPGEAAALFDQFYERSDGKARNDRIAAARAFNMPTTAQNAANVTRTQVNASTQNGTDRSSWMTALPAAFTDNSSLVAVAQRITTPASGDGPSSPLAGQDRVLVQRELRNVQDQYERMNPGKTLKPAAAALVLEQAAAPYRLADRFSFNRRGLSSGSGQYVVDRDLVRSTLEQIQFDNAGNVVGLNDTITRNTANTGAIANSGAAFQAVEAARAEVQRLQADDARLRRFQNPVTRAAEERLIAAQRLLDTVNAGAAANSRRASGR